jgi:hypothetical protein
MIRRGAMGDIALLWLEVVLCLIGCYGLKEGYGWHSATMACSGVVAYRVLWFEGGLWVAECYYG